MNNQVYKTIFFLFSFDYFLFLQEISNKDFFISMDVQTLILLIGYKDITTNNITFAFKAICLIIQTNIFMIIRLL